MKRLVFFFFICWCIASKAQVPGYMGKRFTLGYSTSIYPNLLSSLYNSNTGPVFGHALKLNIIVSRQRELCFATNFSSRKVSVDENYTPGVGYNYRMEKFKSVEYTIGLKRFNRSKFAPLGAYSKWDGIFVSGWVKYDDFVNYQYDATTSDYILQSHEGGKMKFRGGGFSYSRGRQRVFEDKFLVDYGVRGILMFVTEEDIKNSFEENISSAVSGSLNAFPILNLYIGIGLLGF